MQPRRIDPEWLDILPTDDPRAIRSRRDLQRVNSWMGQVGLMARLLREYGPVAPASIVELGCGDGTFMLRVARRLAPDWPLVQVRLVDRQNLVSAATLDGFGACGWEARIDTADALAALGPGRGRADIVTANLFLHHFPSTPLRELLGAMAASARFVAACEPRRASFAALGSRLLFAIGCNDVTRHDALVSVRAGFAASELSRLWPVQAGWALDEHAAGLFTHCFTARRCMETQA